VSAACGRINEQKALGSGRKIQGTSGTPQYFSGTATGFSFSEKKVPPKIHIFQHTGRRKTADP